MASRSRGWAVVLAGTGINLILGSLYAWSVVGRALVGQWHWSRADAALPFSISTLCFAFTMIFAGWWQDKMGPRIVALVGGLMFGLGVFVSAFAPVAVVDGPFLRNPGRHGDRAVLLRDPRPRP